MWRLLVLGPALTFAASCKPKYETPAAVVDAAVHAIETMDEPALLATLGPVERERWKVSAEFQSEAMEVLSSGVLGGKVVDVEPERTIHGEGARVKTQGQARAMWTVVRGEDGTWHVDLQRTIGAVRAAVTSLQDTARTASAILKAHLLGHGKYVPLDEAEGGIRFLLEAEQRQLNVVARIDKSAALHPLGSWSRDEASQVGADNVGFIVTATDASGLCVQLSDTQKMRVGCDPSPSGR